jgi:hypothetical protein
LHNDFINKSVKEIGSAIKSLSKRVEEHLGYIIDPAKALAEKKDKNGTGKLWEEMSK